MSSQIFFGIGHRDRICLSSRNFLQIIFYYPKGHKHFFSLESGAIRLALGPLAAKLSEVGSLQGLLSSFKTNSM
jgi:hypothetical protein